MRSYRGNAAMPTPVPQGLVPKTTDFADRIRANFKTQSAMTTFGIEMLDVVAGHTRLEMMANDRVLQQQGFVHGGVIAAAMDSACGYAALSLAAADREVLTIVNTRSVSSPRPSVNAMNSRDRSSSPAAPSALTRDRHLQSMAGCANWSPR